MLSTPYVPGISRSWDSSGQNKIVIRQGLSPGGGTQGCQVVLWRKMNLVKKTEREAVGWAAPLQRVFSKGLLDRHSLSQDPRDMRTRQWLLHKERSRQNKQQMEKLQRACAWPVGGQQGYLWAQFK